MRLLLLRHAKSSWHDGNLADHDRPLNDRGKADAPRVGELLKSSGRVPDCIVSSTAKRARKTAKKVAAACGFAGEVLLFNELYLASPQQMLQVIHAVPDEAQTLLVVGHNPGIEQLVSQLAGQSLVMPTAALADFLFPIEHWSQLSRSTSGELVELWTPKDSP